jgi:hypothetical protein
LKSEKVAGTTLQIIKTFVKIKKLQQNANGILKATSEVLRQWGWPKD